jgi:hypothetical protein
MNETKKESKCNLNNLMILEIKCFQHCLKSERYLCFELPEKCPTCLYNLNSKIKFKVPPFILPKPLSLTNTRLKCLPPHSLLLQPTDCDYHKLLLEPDIGDLHIGVTNSESDVFDFNQHGLNKNAHNWIETPSIVIDMKSTKRTSRTMEVFSEMKPLVTMTASAIVVGGDSTSSEDNNTDTRLDPKWDLLLDCYWKRRKELWHRAFYDENRFNCLDFVINFLLEYGMFDLNEEQSDLISSAALLNAESSFKQKKNIFILKNFLKQKLSKEFIEPEFFKCLKYLNLLINLYEKKYFLEKI